MDKKKSSKTKQTFVGGLVIIVALLAIMSFQLGLINKHMATLNAAILGTNTAPVPSGADNNQPSAQPTIDMKKLMDDDAVRGDPNAPVTIIEWSDYQCPYCGRFYHDTLGLIEQNYIDTGKVKLVYRDFPLSFHPHAQKAAEAAECAGEQGKYLEMHDKLFGEGVDGGVDGFKQYAADLGLDTNKFNTCLDTGAMKAEIAKDMQDGQAVGIKGTPGFIINGKMVSGAQPYANFKAVIDAALAQ